MFEENYLLATGKEENSEAECPKCGRKANLQEVFADIPVYGKAIISTLKCGRCHFALKDVTADESRGALGYELQVLSRRDLDVKVVYSSTSTIKIPELGVKIEPGPGSEGGIKSIESILKRMRNQTVLTAEDKNKTFMDQKKIARKEIDLLDKALKGELRFKFILMDPFGNGALLGPKVRDRNLTKDEIALLKKSIQILELV